MSYIPSDILNKGLDKLGMLNNGDNNGLKFVKDFSQENNNDIKIHLLEAQKYGAEAVYFRYFENRSPIPQIYIYEEEKDIDSLHKELWSSCIVPMFFIFTKTEIKIFNSMSKKDIDSPNIEPLEIIKIASEVQKELMYFKANMFDSGEFWNEKYNKNFSHKNTAYNSLLDKLAFERDRLIKKTDLSPTLTNSLLIKSILLKYLEEKKVFKLTYWNDFFEGAKSFKDIVQNCKENNQPLIELFSALSRHFNGGIFKFKEDELEELKKADLKEFKKFLQPNIDNKGQLHFWDLYSFKDLPIELISNIYELFLTEDEKKGVVYTPSILVDFMIDEMIPLDSLEIDFKVIDPACGSGIFLVATFKRLVQRWMINNDFKTPSVEILKSLIIDNIFGIDIKKEAVEVAKFSLSLALCDILAPEVIWDELHFDDLSQTGNLISNDFFELLLHRDDYPKIKDFDLVIGNPPFMSDKIISKKLNILNRPKLPDDNLAYLFIEQSFKLLKKDALISMVQNSGILYNNNVELFRKYLLENFNLRQVIDFTGLNKLYDGSKKDNKGKKVSINVPTAVLCFENNKPDMEAMKTMEVLHLTVRQTFEAKEKLYFDLSYYDFHWINYKEAIENRYIWKCNLVGGNRVVDIVNRLNQYKMTLGKYLEDKIDNNNWVYLEGYMAKNNNTTKPKYAEYMTGEPFLPAKAFLEEGIDDSQICIEKAESFHRIKPKELFTPPHLLIKKKLGKYKIVSELRDDYLIFKNDTIGIHAPETDRKDLQLLSNTLVSYSKEYLFYLIATSGKAGVDKATVLYKNDIDNLPYPKNIEDIKLSKTEQYFADDTIDYMLDWINGKQDLPIFENVDEIQIKEYQNIYCDLINTVYNKFIPLEVLQTEQFIIMSFYYKNKPNNYLFDDDSLSDKDIENLINKKIGKNVNITRVFKYYDNNLIYIIKPKQYRYWLKSIAVKDADDTFADLVDMRY
ncbi:MAG: N-6 DNA methylase [Sulfurovum sp.]